MGQVTEERSIDFEIRPALANERRWVQAVWSRCAKIKTRASDTERLVSLGAPNTQLWLRGDLIYRAHHRIVDELLSSATVVVAALCRMPDDPIGFAVFERPTLHYVYVSPDARLCSVGSQLVLHANCTSVSHMTADGARLMRRHSGPAH